jgi:acetoin utilization protein AcuB
MNVTKLMTKKVISVRALDSVETAVQLLNRRGVRHLLVMDRGRLQGIISDRDIKRAMDTAKSNKRIMSVGGLYFLLEPILVEEVMTTEVLTILPTTSVYEAAKIMVGRRFGALPVMQKNKVVGIITETDLLRYFASTEPKTGAKPKKKASKAKKKKKTAAKKRG